MNLVTPTPRVSVLLPVRNGLPYLRMALDSILTQTLTDLEVIVVDDDSTDGSRLVVLGTGDPRVRVLDGRGLGVAHALNLALRAARAPYVARQDADDLSAPTRLARLADFLDANPEIAVATSRVSIVDAAGRPAGTDWARAVRDGWEAARTPEQIARLMPVTCCIVHGSVMARRSTLQVAGGYDETRLAEDYDLWLRLLPGTCFARLPDALYTHRLHADQVTRDDPGARILDVLDIKLAHLRRTVRLPSPATVRLLGDGRGAGLYREALAARGFVEAGPSDDWDVAIGTDFGTLDDALASAAAARPGAALTRVGNFLVARNARETAA
ncbi:MAG: glycosyltransferase family 2 protein [Vicinamibacterales bacterium]